MRRRIRGFAALIGLAAIVVGLPALLVAVHNVGAPHFGWSWQGLVQALSTPDDGTLALTLFKLAGWVSWAILTFAVGLELLARTQHLPVPRLRGLELPQMLARLMVAAAATLFVAAASVTSAPPSAAAPNHSITAPAALPQYRPPAAPHHDKEKAEPTRDRTYTVHKGDTLSEIALEATGKATNYTKIFMASKKTEQPGGRHLSDPDLILPGWTVTIPGTRQNDSGLDRKDEPTAAQTGQTESERPSHPTPQVTATPTTEGSPSASSTSHSPAQPTPAQPSSSLAPPETEPDGAHADSSPAWLLSGLAGAGSLLAGGLWLTLHRRRAVQSRSRRPGRTVAAPPPELAPVEKTLMHEGSPTGSLVVFIDEALRRLVAHFVTTGEPLPVLAGVDATPDHLTVRLKVPAALPEVWESIDGGAHQIWRIGRTLDLDLVGKLEADSPPPWPQLVTLGWDAHGWRLVNLEALGVVSLTGDRVYAEDLVRYLVSELAVSPWSRDVEVDCLAVGEELPGLAPARVHFHRLTDVIVDRVASCVATADRLTESGSPSLETARVTFAGDELWDSRVVVTSIVDADHLDVLTRLVAELPGRTATSVLLMELSTPPTGLEMRLTTEGRIQVPALELDLVANGLTEAEARGCVAVLAAGEDLSEVNIPMVDDPDADEWAGFCNTAGSLREELTVPRGSDVAGATSLMPEPDGVYLAQTANTVEDLATLAPLVPDTVRQRVEAVDPALDLDLAQWWGSSSNRPRLQVLGPLKVRVGPSGEPSKAAPRLAFCTEVVAYLSTRPGGATTQEMADALGISVARVRRDLSTVRAWLGPNPATGDPFLPEAMKSPQAIERGVGVYLIEGLLCDADLFRRLRLRGESRGVEGLDDLRLALRLVHGAPFDDMRAKGGLWLAESRLDQHLLCGIVDVAHMVSTIAVETGDLQQARAAAELAALAAPNEATPQLDLAAVAAREGRPGLAAEIARSVVSWRDGSGDGPVDLSNRAEAILRTHRWLERASRAS